MVHKNLDSHVTNDNFDNLESVSVPLQGSGSISNKASHDNSVHRSNTQDVGLNCSATSLIAFRTVDRSRTAT